MLTANVTNVSVPSVPIVRNTLDLFDTTIVNNEENHVEIVSFVIVLILGVNIPIIYTVSNDKSGTFINRLILLDCANALAHVPILLEYFQ